MYIKVRGRGWRESENFAEICKRKGSRIVISFLGECSVHLLPSYLFGALHFEHEVLFNSRDLHRGGNSIEQMGAFNLTGPPSYYLVDLTSLWCQAMKKSF